ncbi:thiamine-phosphate synthase family protein [Halolamina litorea]|uniref:Thiamine-phosphate synthase family protein n=1 Tax=Halolamina litorea TaxID=1515593 RepID=A0ABD6BMD0_9EURY|nr:thiamine-phosphate synthase family protein [Halolamina litorea]
MKFIEEVVVDAFLPTYRAMLAERLRDRGLTQSAVADLLGISQSAVSKYAHGDVEGHPDVANDERVQALADRVAAGLADGTLSRVGALVEAEVLIRQLEDGDLLARLHEEAVPELADADATFAVHDVDSTLRTGEQVLASVRRGLRVLTNASGFAGSIPNVGTNLVESLPDPTGIEDVAAVPGRIVDVNGVPTVPGDPEFGVSEHVAGVLLSARAAGADASAALNIAYDEAILTALADAGYETVEFDSEIEGDAVEAAVADARLVEGEPFVLYQTGAHGVEAITYVLGPDAPTVARAVVDTLLR